MADNPRLKEAVMRVVGKPEGRELLEHFKRLYESDKEALVMTELPEQVRRLQGSARRTKEIISLFNFE